MKYNLSPLERGVKGCVYFKIMEVISVSKIEAYFL